MFVFCVNLILPLLLCVISPTFNAFIIFCTLCVGVIRDALVRKHIKSLEVIFLSLKRTMLIEDAYQFFDEFTAREWELSGIKLSDHIIFYGYDYHLFTSFFSHIIVCWFEALDLYFLKYWGLNWIVVVCICYIFLLVA